MELALRPEGIRERTGGIQSANRRPHRQRHVNRRAILHLYVWESIMLLACCCVELLPGHALITHPSVALQLDGARHGTSTESIPPFSYCENSAASPLALGQPPRVTFSPPFDAAYVSPRGQGQGLGHGHGHGHDSSLCSSPLFGVRIHHHHHPRTSVPVLLESLPESPFSCKGCRYSATSWFRTCFFFAATAACKHGQ